MAYADAQTPEQKAAGIAGAAIAHAGIGALIVLGLSVTGVVPQIIDTGPMTPIDYKPEIPPPPPKPPEEVTEDPITNTQIVTPPNDNPLKDPIELSDTIIELPPISDEIQLKIYPKPLPSPTPGFGKVEPVPAVPSNSPGSWIRDSDYKSRWVREEKYGRASFTVAINAKGRVENCSITSSTGHAALDNATCKLITKRARFKPAQASDGSPTSGTFSSSIRWVLPD